MDDLRLCNTQAFGHLLIEEPLARAVGLHPFAINHKLRDGARARAFNNLVGRAGRGFDVDFFEGNVVFFQEAFGDAAVRAPEGGIDEKFHVSGSQYGRHLARERRSLDWQRLAPSDVRSVPCGTYRHHSFVITDMLFSINKMQPGEREISLFLYLGEIGETAVYIKA